jgi:hypothetical protein
VGRARAAPPSLGFPGLGLRDQPVRALEARGVEVEQGIAETTGETSGAWWPCPERRGRWYRALAPVVRLPSRASRVPAVRLHVRRPPRCTRPSAAPVCPRPLDADRGAPGRHVGMWV